VKACSVSIVTVVALKRESPVFGCAEGRARGPRRKEPVIARRARQ
jgi:hypothetical protein